MKACDRCVRLSLLQNEAAGFAEESIAKPSDARRLMHLPSEELVERLAREFPGIEQRLKRRMSELREAQCQDDRHWAFCEHDPIFPDNFRQLADPPSVVYGMGSVSRFEALMDGPSVAIVGARRASSYGRDVAYMLGNELSAAGLTVVSGMALGIDGAAHRGALQGGKRTIAVLAGGPERPYPQSHKQLYSDIVDAGAVISERPPGSIAQKWGFPARNRLIAGLGDLTVIVEGTLKSGAKHTIDFAMQIGQDVAAVPGPVTSPLSDAPNEVIFDHGSMIRGAGDVLDLLGGIHPVDQLPGIEDDAELPITLAEVLGCVQSGDGTPQAIALRLPMLSTRDVVRALGELELMGRVTRNNSGDYLRSAKRRGTG